MKKFVAIMMTLILVSAIACFAKADLISSYHTSFGKANDVKGYFWDVPEVYEYWLKNKSEIDCLMIFSIWDEHGCDMVYEKLLLSFVDDPTCNYVKAYGYIWTDAGTYTGDSSIMSDDGFLKEKPESVRDFAEKLKDQILFDAAKAEQNGFIMPKEVIMEALFISIK